MINHNRDMDALAPMAASIAAIIKVTAIAAAIALALHLQGCSGGGGSASPIPIPVVVKPTATPRVVFIGDSITYRWDTVQFAGSGQRLSDLLPGAIDVGISGQTSAQMLKRFKSDVLDKAPTVVVILAGTNDMYLEPDACSIEHIYQMAADARAYGARVILGITTPTNDWQLQRYHGLAGNAAMAAWVADLKHMAASYGFEIADYRAGMLTAQGIEDTSLFLADGVHPSAAGYEAMWDVLEPIL